MLPMKDLQRHVAWASVGPTTLRKMVPRGGRRCACRFLSTIDLSSLHHAKFADLLDVWTDELSKRLEDRWGPARKAMNLFLRDLSYNTWLRKEFNLGSYESQFEVPLDGKVMLYIREENANLPTLSVVSLNKEVSNKYQAEAFKIAKAKGFARVHLDLLIWSLEAA